MTSMMFKRIEFISCFREKMNGEYDAVKDRI